jgi:hypothetical protein
MRRSRPPARAVFRRQDLQLVEEVVDGFVVGFDEPDAERVGCFAIAVGVSEVAVSAYNCNVFMEV